MRHNMKQAVFSAALTLSLPLCLAFSADAWAQEALPQETQQAQQTRNVPVAVSRAEALDLLFAELAVARSRDEASVLRDEIWKIWLLSGSPAIDLLMSRSVDAMEARQLHHALNILNRMVVLAPEFSEAWNKRATVLYHLGKMEHSLADIARTLELEPRHFGALSGLAAILDSRGDHAGAARTRERIRALTPLLRP